MSRVRQTAVAGDRGGERGLTDTRAIDLGSIDPAVADPVGVSSATTLRYESPDALFAVYYSKLVRLATGVSGDPEAAADAVQEAFVQLWLRWDTIGQYESPVAWVHRVALNRLKNQRRASARLARALARWRDGVGRTSAPAPSAEYASEARLLLEALRRLPEKQRVAVCLHFISGLTVVETAEVMRIGTGSVSQHLSRGRARLRELLGEG